MDILERFEGEIAVIETDNGMRQVPRNLLPAGAREGDVLVQTPEGNYLVDANATQARRERLARRTKRLKQQS